MHTQVALQSGLLSEPHKLVLLIRCLRLEQGLPEGKQGYTGLHHRNHPAAVDCSFCHGLTCLCRFALLSNVCYDTGKNTELSQACSVIWIIHSLLPHRSFMERVFYTNQRNLHPGKPICGRRDWQQPSLKRVSQAPGAAWKMLLVLQLERLR